MHHLPRIFLNKKQSKRMDQTPTPSTPSPRHKLVRRNAAKNIEYTPSPSTSTSPSTSGSSAHRTRSLDLPHGADLTSFRMDGSQEMDSIFQSLGLSGLEDLEIPKAAWEALKSRSSSDIIVRPKRGHFDISEPVKPEKQDVHKFNDNLPHRFGNDAQMNGVIEADPSRNEPKLPGPVNRPLDGNSVGPVGKGGGIKGDRPPLLTPPPSMSITVLDDGCSTWELINGLAPNGDSPPCFSRLNISHIPDDEEDEEEGDGVDVQGEGLNGVRIGETVVLSGSCSFTTNEDDSSSTTTEPVSIISPNSGCRLNITHWEKGALLGRGSFGTVYEGISSEGFFFAVKEVSLLEQGSQGRQCIYQLEQEIELLSQFEHENIVRYLGTDKDMSNLYIFLELVTQGSLARLYQKYHLRDSHVSAYTRQILLGLKYLHDRKVVHRDIKCANILVAADGTVKLADFGLAKATRFNDLKSYKGTGYWMAPEVVNQRNQGYGLGADIWSLGCTVLEMITGQLPYYPLEPMQAVYKIGQGEAPPISEALSRDAREFIQQCLRVNPNDRPTAAELLEHPFVRRTLYAQLGSESPMMPSR